MFRNREDAARQLAEKLKGRQLHDPLVLAIPRGGVVTGAVLARELGADLDVVLSRKLRAPGQPELAIGAISEDGRVYLNHHAEAFLDLLEDYLAEERRHQLSEIGRRKKLFRAVRPEAPITGRSVIVTDDGIATGSTMIAALQAVKTQNPQRAHRRRARCLPGSTCGSPPVVRRRGLLACPGRVLGHRAVLRGLHPSRG